MEGFDIKKFLTENKITRNSRLNEESPESMDPTTGTGLESTKHVFEIEYTNEPVDIDAEETLILALLENDDNAVQYLRKYIKDIRLV